MIVKLELSHEQMVGLHAFLHSDDNKIKAVGDKNEYFTYTFYCKDGSRSSHLTFASILGAVKAVDGGSGIGFRHTVTILLEEGAELCRTDMSDDHEPAGSLRVPDELYLSFFKAVGILRG